MRLQHKHLSALLLFSLLATAQSGGDFNIKKSSIDAGGGQSVSGNFIVTGTTGQADASKVISGGNFSLTGGFWNQKPVIREDLIFTNGFED